MLPDVVFGCLHDVIAGGVPAEGASALWNPQIFGGGSLVDEVAEGADAGSLPEFSSVIFHCGGAGARPDKDGLSATSFPSGVRTIPVEATESVVPVVFYRREFREGSGGVGKRRGGLGQIIEIGGAGENPVVMLCNFERMKPGAIMALRLTPTAISTAKRRRGSDRLSLPQADSATGALALASCNTMSEPFSPIITAAALVLPDTSDGMIEASMTRSRSKPRTRSRSSTTADGSGPMRQVDVG
jgi:N-methylhydantoinase B/oxoprolinase/acetone carboxylase alpha subunit